MSLKTLLRHTPLFHVARSAYRHIHNREALRTERQLRTFYSQFVKRGDVVFDVGANTGEHTEILCSLGARVLAVEPLPACVSELETLRRHCKFTIEPVAVSDVPGTATMTIGRWNGYSTLSTEYKERAPEEFEWAGEVEVPVTTLDSLAAKHGVPSFVKIDVEGFEQKVMRGMSFRPHSLTFEYHLFNLDIAEWCLSTLSGYEFNYLVGEDHILRSDKWLDGLSLLNAIRRLPSKPDYGDVVARLIAPSM